jgi:pimeloyl-ACP methyl ester carboxylesterase
VISKGFAAFLVMVFALATCQSRFIYFPRLYEATHVQRWQKLTQGEVLAYETSAGKQQAYLFQPISRSKPQHLWLVCAGNGSVATDWTVFLNNGPPREDAYLLIDYPGYGANDGSPSPTKIRESIAKALLLARNRLDWDEKTLSERGRFFGHSLGAASALIGADDAGITRGVLLAPFTSTMEMTKEVLGVNLGFILWHRFDNIARLENITCDSAAKVEIFHGMADPVIPYRMSESLRKIAPDRISLHLVPRGGHNDLQEMNRREIIEAMHRVREP